MMTKKANEFQRAANKSGRFKQKGPLLQRHTRLRVMMMGGLERGEGGGKEGEVVGPLAALSYHANQATPFRFGIILGPPTTTQIPPLRGSTSKSKLLKRGLLQYFIF